MALEAALREHRADGTFEELDVRGSGHFRLVGASFNSRRRDDRNQEECEQSSHSVVNVTE
jgi:hypothetical protein